MKNRMKWIMEELMAKRSIWILLVFGMIVLGFVGYRFYQDRVADAAVQELVNEYEKPEQIEEFIDAYDVIVIGGEPEGVAAAVSAARNGAKTLLVESRAELGGLFTYGMLNFLDIPQGHDLKSVSQGIYNEWHQLVGGENAFGITAAKAAFQKLIDVEENITLAIETEVVKSIVEQNKVKEVVLKSREGEYRVSGKTFIDATQDADFAAMSQVPYFTGGEDIGIKDKKMAVTLMIHLKNVDWEKVKQTAKSEKFGPAEVNDTVAWGFSKLHYDYKPVEENTRLRGLNLVKIEDEYYINALQIFGIDGLDDQSKQEAIEKGKRETKHILAYLQKEFPGFENAEIVSFPTELYVRETRHIWAEHQLSMSDVWTNKDYWDSIGFGAYPVDVQAQTPQDYGYVLATPEQYSIPFRSLVPKEIDGLLVVGRSAGFSSLAAGSARVVPTGMVAGEAAGVAAALAVKKEVSFRSIGKSEALIGALRETLDQQGAFVDHLDIDYPYKGEWYDKSIQTLMDYGLVVGGYSNDLKVDDVATKHSFANMLNASIQRANPTRYKQLKSKIDEAYFKVIYAKNGPLHEDEAVAVLAEVFLDEKDLTTGQTLIDKGVISGRLIKHMPAKNEELTLKEMYAISASVINYVKP